MASLLQRAGGESALETLLRDFYTRARHDELIGPIFEREVRNWEYHLARVVVYWRRQTEGEPNYRQSFPLKHKPLRLQKPHFDRWLSLFKSACDRHLRKQEAADIFDIALRVAANLYQVVAGDQDETKFSITHVD